MPLFISNQVTLPDSEIELSAIRAQGSGGQNVNKVSTAIHLRFDIRASSLPLFYKEKLLALSDYRITNDGVIVIKAQEHRTQEKNKEAALNRLQALIQKVAIPVKKRIATRPTKSSQKRRLNHKKQKGHTKSLRKKPSLD